MLIPVNQLPVLSEGSETSSCCKHLTECPASGAFIVFWIYNDRLHSQRAWYDEKGTVVWRRKDDGICRSQPARAELLPMVKLVGFMQFEGDLADGW